eukprot:1936124-Karenia_brevis.AAC.1
MSQSIEGLSLSLGSAVQKSVDARCAEMDAGSFLHRDELGDVMLQAIQKHELLSLSDLKSTLPRYTTDMSNSMVDLYSKHE